jgi:hypothetical protein
MLHDHRSQHSATLHVHGFIRALRHTRIHRRPFSTQQKNQNTKGDRWDRRPQKPRQNARDLAPTNVTVLDRWAMPASPTAVSERSRLCSRRMSSNAAMPTSVM